MDYGTHVISRGGLSGTTGGIFDLGVRFGRQQSVGRQGAEGMMTREKKTGWIMDLFSSLMTVEKWQSTCLVFMARLKNLLLLRPF